MEADQGKRMRDILEENALFPFSRTDLTQSRNSTEPSLLEADRLDRRWKATIALQDDSLVDALCSILDEILGDKRLSVSEEIELLACFAPKLDSHGRDTKWSDNLNERKSIMQTRSW
ncbi:hypothetical protein DFH11DRAFT_589622 [Phellopilus nigrolimitatus]|nr:hypothetical protein DFH11DRAFT_589622 [Phellopilus nigrolimitatus]